MIINKSKQILQHTSPRRTLLKQIAVTIPIATIPFFAYAGIFSVVGGVAFGEETKKNETRSMNQNSQTLSLLEVNLETHREINGPATGGPKIVIVDDSVLLSEWNPGNSDLDLAEITGTTGQISVYTVKTGDTISQIAEKFGVSTNTIRWANDLGTKGLIKVGQELTILPVTGVKHRVAKGETLSSIAEKFDADLSEVAVFNGFEVDAILEVGSEIIVPDGELGETVVTEKNSKGEITTTTTKTKNTYGTARDVNNYYAQPVRGVVTQWFHGPHQALDIGAPTGTAVAAMADGVVLISKSSGYNGGYGQMIIIQHPNDTQTIYAHLSQNNVVPGQSVKQGQQIGSVGSTGRSTGPHLHYEVRGVGKPVKTPIIYSKP